MKRFLSLVMVAALLLSTIVVGSTANELTDEEILAERQQIALDYMREMVSLIWRASDYERVLEVF